MHPDESQSQTAETKTTSQVTQSAPQDATQASPALNPNVQVTKSKKKLIILITLLVIVIAVAVVTALLVHNHKKTNTTANNTANHATTNTNTKPSTPVVAPAVTDTWTGGGANSNWSDASNWSNGIPKTNYSLVFNLAPHTSNGQLTSNNDLTGLSLNSLTFEGGTSNAHGVEDINLTGNPISLSNGIVAKTEADVSSSIAFGVTLTSNQTFNINADFGFVPVSSSNLASTNLNLSSYTLTVTGTNGISFNYLSGGGTLAVKPTSGNTAVIGVGQPSPNFSGTVKIEAGLFAIDYGNSLGTATIDVNNGGTLRIVTDSNSSLVSNNLNLTGKGNVDSSGNYFGAINIVGSNQRVTLGGKITLYGNTQLGIYNATSNNPGDGNGTFTLSQAPTLNGYTLSGLTSNTKVVTQ